MKRPLTRIIEEANIKLLVEGNLDLIGDFFSPDYTVHLTGRTLNGGHDLVRSVLGALRTSFPEPEVEVDILLEDEDRVAWQRTLRAVHQIKFKGFPASGRTVVWRDMVTSRFDNGCIAEEWVISDLAEQLLLARKS